MQPISVPSLYAKSLLNKRSDLMNSKDIEINGLIYTYILFMKMVKYIEEIIK